MNFRSRLALGAAALLYAGTVANANTVTLSTSDVSVVAQLGKPGQGWWSLDTPNISTNTNYITGTAFNVSPASILAIEASLRST
jgi:hypothetical protein